MALFRTFVCMIVFVAQPAWCGLVEWTSEDGRRRLESAVAKADFYRLANQFESQKNKLFCGPTTSAIVLNALRLGNVALPEDKETFPADAEKFLPKDFNPRFRRYTQETFLQGVEKIKGLQELYGKPTERTGQKADYGIQLRQLQLMLEHHGVEAKMQIVSEADREAAEAKEIVRNLSTEGDYVIVNYARAGVGQKGGGHISPVGAYDEKSDSFLVMDVNPNAAPWAWIDRADLFRAMRTKDVVENRGFLLVTEKNAPKAPLK